MEHPTNRHAWADANRKAGWAETPLPLPGLYPCLTLQANVTLHKPTGMGKFVMVMREPNDHVEVGRVFQELEPWAATARPALAQFEAMLSNLGYLMSINGELYR